jgi:hypothetical protein
MKWAPTLAPPGQISRRLFRAAAIGAVGRFRPPPIFGFRSGFDGRFDRDGQVAFKAESCPRYFTKALQCGVFVFLGT